MFNRRHLVSYLTLPAFFAFSAKYACSDVHPDNQLPDQGLRRYAE